MSYSITNSFCFFSILITDVSCLLNYQLNLLIRKRLLLPFENLYQLRDVFIMIQLKALYQIQSINLNFSVVLVFQKDLKLFFDIIEEVFLDLGVWKQSLKVGIVDSGGRYGDTWLNVPVFVSFTNSEVVIFCLNRGD